MARDEFDRLRVQLPNKRAVHWFYYPCYDLLTRPELRPLDQDGEAVFFETIGRMRDQLSGIAVLGQLSFLNQNRFAALVIDILELFESYWAYASTVALLQEYSQVVGRRRLNKLNRLTEQLEAFLTDMPSPDFSPEGHRDC